MPLAELAVDLPERTWVHEVSTTHPEAALRVLAAMPDGDVGFALLELRAPEPAALLGSMADHDGLLAVEPLQRTDDRVLVRIETATPLVLLSAQASGVPVEPPIRVREGTARLEVRAPRDRLSALGDQLERFGLTYTVEAVHDDPEADPLLSARQRELLLAAVEAGYYETPRTCTLTELAGEVGLAKSTTSEILHRAESRIIERFVAERFGTVDADPPAPSA